MQHLVLRSSPYLQDMVLVLLNHTSASMHRRSGTSVTQSHLKTVPLIKKLFCSNEIEIEDAFVQSLMTCNAGAVVFCSQERSSGNSIQMSLIDCTRALCQL